MRDHNLRLTTYGVGSLDQLKMSFNLLQRIETIQVKQQQRQSLARRALSAFCFAPAVAQDCDRRFRYFDRLYMLIASPAMAGTAAFFTLAIAL